MPAINAFLRQRVEEGIPFEETIAGLKRLVTAGEEEDLY